MSKPHLLGNRQEVKKFGVSTGFQDLFRTTNLNELYENTRTHLISSFAEQKMKGLGWVLDKILFLELLIVDYSPLQNVNEELLPS